MPAKTSKKRTTYHHGDLRAALIAAADAIIAESGLEGFSLRAAAVRAGVSPGAPAHHFGSAKGLLTEVALLAYARLAEAIEAVKPLSDPVAEVRSLTLVFVTFAVTHPGHFRLMFRGDLVNREDPRFAEVGPESGKRLSASVMAYRGYSEVDRTRFEDTADMLCGMAAMHGIAHMVVEGKALHFFPKEQRMDFVKKTLPRVIERMYPDVLPAETRGRTKR